MIDVSIVVATCGTPQWQRMGDMAAVGASATGAKVIRVHSDNGTVSGARNAGLEQVTTEYVVFLDADDNIRPDYFDGVEPNADVIATSIEYLGMSFPIMPDVWAHEYYPHLKHEGHCHADCLVDGNYIHVGAIARASAVRAVGGFKEYPVYEDWALWLAIYKNGGTFDSHEQSVYVANARFNDNHRNRSIPLADRNVVHEQIVSDLVAQ